MFFSSMSLLLFLQCVSVTPLEPLRRSVTKRLASVCVRRTSCSPNVTAVPSGTTTIPHVKVSPVQRSGIRKCQVFIKYVT